MTPPNLLAIDTSSACGSVALCVNGKIGERRLPVVREHNQHVLPAIDDLLKAAGITLAQLDAIAFGQGPGSFVGARLAASVVQGLAYGADVPVIALSSLQILAQTAYRTQQLTSVLVGVDAHMQKLYVAHYQLQQGIMKLCGEEQCVLREQIQSPITPITKVGDGFGNPLFPAAQDALILAEKALQAGQLLTPEQAIPVYLPGSGEWKKISL